MKRTDFYYDLPQELIAQDPLADRQSSRLMCLDKKTGETQHKHFYDIIDMLNEGDCLILNDTMVIPARLYGESSEKVSSRKCFGLKLLQLTASRLFFTVLFFRHR